MKTSELDYFLPVERIAQTPTVARDDARLLVVNRNEDTIQHRRFSDFPSLLDAGDLLVRNVTRVLPARLFAHRATGGRVELFLVDRLGDDDALALVRPRRRLREGEQLTLDSGLVVTISETDGDDSLLHVSAPRLAQHAMEHGSTPLPPYITRDPDEQDRTRYQTIYARNPGSVAAPTAGLHFTERTDRDLIARGIQLADVSLHVGIGTFRPVRCDRLEDHPMHEESFEVPSETVDAVSAARARGGRIIAVGTTTVRCLESAARGDHLRPANQRTRIFIRPGYEIRIVDALLTNFHQPRSTLLALVAAFIGLDKLKRTYQIAIDEKYRFLSYGDAMLIL